MALNVLTTRLHPEQSTALVVVLVDSYIVLVFPRGGSKTGWRVVHAVAFVDGFVANAAPNRKNKDENFAMADDLNCQQLDDSVVKNMRMQTLRNEENTIQSPRFIPCDTEYPT